MSSAKKVYGKVTRKTKLIGAVAALSLTASLMWSAGMRRKPVQVPVYRVLRMIDGDTFETTEKQLIRLSHVDSPELGYCGGPESKAALEKLIRSQPLYLKVLYRDKYNRLESLVYTPGNFINAEMVRTGNSYYLPAGGEYIPELVQANTEARQAKRGIFSAKCTQVKNTGNPSCNIKGNLRLKAGTSYYHFPGCPQYENTDVQLFLGDRWFCTVKEAEEAGFAKAQSCPSVYTKSSF